VNLLGAKSARHEADHPARGQNGKAAKKPDTVAFILQKLGAVVLPSWGLSLT